MNDKTKEEVKRNAATGASTAAGATAGVIIGAAITPESAEAQEAPTPEPTTQHTATNPKPTTNAQQQTTDNQQPTSNQQQPTNDPKPTTNDPEPTTTDSEVEVVGYERITNDDGSQSDIAVINVNGNEIGVIDANLDGNADVIACDVNGNGIIDAGETQDVHDQGIAMQPLQDAAGFNPGFASNDIPDYVNDADVDTYMA